MNADYDIIELLFNERIDPKCPFCGFKLKDALNDYEKKNISTFDIMRDKEMTD